MGTLGKANVSMIGAEIAGVKKCLYDFSARKGNKDDEVEIFHRAGLAASCHRLQGQRRAARRRHGQLYRNGDSGIRTDVFDQDRRPISEDSDDFLSLEPDRFIQAKRSQNPI